MSRTGILSLIMLTLVSLQPIQAQDKDSKMGENLKMMEKVLNEVFRSGNPEPDQLNVRTNSTDAQYIEGFGILMRTPLFYWSGSNFISLNGTAWSESGVYIRQNGEAAPTPSEEAGKDSERISQDEIDQVKIDLMTYFLQNYGDLASELPKNEKIMLIYGSKNNRNSRVRATGLTIAGSPRATISSTKDRKPGTITVSISKNDIDRFRSRDLSEDGFKKALSIENLPANDKKRMSYQILGQILEDIVSEYRISPVLNSKNNIIQGQYNYAVGLAGSSRSDVNYEVLSGYGAVYKLNVKSSLLGFYSGKRGQKGSRLIIDGKVFDTEDGKKVGSSAHDNIVDSVYQAMVPAVQRAMIEYGRTLRELGSDEWLSVKIEIPACNSCEAPATVEINVPQKVLEAYDTRSISLDTAIGRMDVKGKGQAKDKSSSSSYLYFGDDWDQDQEDE